MYLGSFAGGLFQGAQSAFSLYHAFQGIQADQYNLDAAAKRMKQLEEEEAARKAGGGIPDSTIKTGADVPRPPGYTEGVPTSTTPATYAPPGQVTRTDLPPPAQTYTPPGGPPTRYGREGGPAPPPGPPPGPPSYTERLSAAVAPEGEAGTVFPSLGQGGPPYGPMLDPRLARYTQPPRYASPGAESDVAAHNAEEGLSVPPRQVEALPPIPPTYPPEPTPTARVPRPAAAPTAPLATAPVGGYYGRRLGPQGEPVPPTPPTAYIPPPQQAPPGYGINPPEVTAPETDLSNLPPPPPPRERALPIIPSAQARPGTGPGMQEGTTPRQPAPVASVPGGGSMLTRALASLNPIGGAQAAEAGAPAAPAEPGTAPDAKVQIPPPATQGVTTAQPPTTPEKAAETKAGPVVVAGVQGKVVPGQQGPSAQSESTPARTGGGINPGPWARIQQRDPAMAQLVLEVTRDHGGGGVTPEILSTFVEAESGWRVDARGAAGERGLGQIMPKTQAGLDPSGRLDPFKAKDNLILTTELLKELGNSYGHGTAAQLVGYMRGSGGVTAASQDFEKFLNTGNNHLVRERLKHAFGDAAGQFNTASFASGSGGERSPYNYKAALQAAEEGPNGYLDYLVSNGPPGLTMTDRQRSLQASMEAGAIAHGRYDMLPAIQDWIAQQSHQGALSNLAAGHQALLNKDPRTAALFFAKAHAFFPDGSYARFAVDKAGQLWAERYDEKSNNTLGKPMKITPEGVMGQMMTLQNPAKYSATVMQHQKDNAKIELDKAHAEYYKALPGIAENKLENARVIEQMKEAHRQQLKDEQEKSTTAVDAAINKQYTPDNALDADGKKIDSQAWANQSEVDRRLRLPRTQGGGGMGGPHATALAEKLRTGEVRLDRVPMANGSLADVFYARGDTKGEHPLAVLHTMHGDAIRALPGINIAAPSMATAPAPGRQSALSPVGAGAGSQVALSRGYNQSLSGIPMTQAV